MRLKNTHILLGVTGGIAAYKTPELIRGLTSHGAEVRVILTEGAAQFVTPTTLEAVSGHKPYSALFGAETTPLEHIELARWADTLLIAPATAHSIAKLAHGLADDLLSTVALATQAPIWLAPAMNRLMWENTATQANLQLLKARDVTVLPVGVGEQACGEWGEGRMLEPAQLIAHLISHHSHKPLQGKHVMITAGPTREWLDPVRFISNPSSGKMGYALAEAAQKLGATVTLITGPTALPAPLYVECIEVETAQDMLEAVMTHIYYQDMFIGTAAVGDYAPAATAPHKLKKSAESMTLTLNPTPDILKIVSQLPDKPFCVGFAAETNNMLEYARRKLETKGCDLICANDVSDATIGFNNDDNALTVISREHTWTLPKQSKAKLAFTLFDLIMEHTTEDTPNAILA